jgi:poly(A) polymerase
MDEVLDVQSEKLAITRRIAGDIKDIWALQPRFEKRAGKSPYRLIELPRFRAGYDFLALRAESGEIDMEIATWWDDFQNADHESREALLIPDSGPKKRRRRVRGKKSAGEGDVASSVAGDAASEG